MKQVLSSFIVIATLLATGHAVSAAPLDRCAVVREVAGKWAATTRVTTSKSKGGIGVAGYYGLSFEAKDGCRLEVRAVKSGYASKVYAPDEVLFAEATVTVEIIGSEDDPRRGEYLLKFPLTLRSEAKGLVEMQVELIWTPKKLFGKWQYTGASWASAGMAGYLLGEQRPKDGRVAFASARSMPCDRACELAGYHYDSNGSSLCQEECTASGPASPVE